jgi:molybdate transport system substrate-binding protein
MRARGRLPTRPERRRPCLAHTALLTLLVAALASACGDGDGGRTLRVFAASSLDEALPVLIERFEAGRPGIDVEPVYGGSQLLATQIEEGAPADVLLAANRAQAERLDAAGLAARLLPFAANALVAVVPQESSITSYEELAGGGVRIAVGAADVPVGALTRAALALLDPAIAEGIAGNVVTEDPSVRVVLSRVELGEVDAAFVYETDAARGRSPDDGALRALPLPAAVPLNEYVAALLDEAGADAEPDADGSAFLDFLAGEEAHALLRAAGFRPPPSSAAAGPTSP